MQFIHRIHGFLQCGAGKLLIAAVAAFHGVEMVSAFRHRYPKIDVSISIGEALG
jgi:hypothetical protein